MATLQARFNSTGDKRSQEFECSVEFRYCESNADNIKLYEAWKKVEIDKSSLKSVDRYTYKTSPLALFH